MNNTSFKNIILLYKIYNPTMPNLWPVIDQNKCDDATLRMCLQWADYERDDLAVYICSSMLKKPQQMRQNIRNQVWQEINEMLVV